MKKFYVLLLLMFSSESLASELRDVKGPLLHANNWWFLFWTLVGCSFLAIIIYLIRKLRAKEVVERRVLKSPWEIAVERIEQLRKSTLVSEGRIKEYFSDLSEIIRQYFEDQFAIRAPEMTSDEFMHLMKTSETLNEEQKDLLKEFLEACDMVKFAKYQPKNEEIDTCLDYAETLVVETKKEDKEDD